MFLCGRRHPGPEALSPSLMRFAVCSWTANTEGNSATGRARAWRASVRVKRCFLFKVGNDIKGKIFNLLPVSFRISNKHSIDIKVNRQPRICHDWGDFTSMIKWVELDASGKTYDSLCSVIDYCNLFFFRRLRGRYAEASDGMSVIEAFILRASLIYPAIEEER